MSLNREAGCKFPHDPVAVIVSIPKYATGYLSGKAWKYNELKSEELPDNYFTAA